MSNFVLDKATYKKKLFLYDDKFYKLFVRDKKHHVFRLYFRITSTLLMLKTSLKPSILSFLNIVPFGYT